MDTTPQRTAPILVIEDDEGLARLICKRLAARGYTMDYLLNGTAALEWLSSHPDTLVILDYRLPDINGQALIEALHKMDLKVPFIVVTGYGDEHVAVEMMKLGAYDYLTKDATFLNVLPAVIEKVLSQIETEKRLHEAEMALNQTKSLLNEKLNALKQVSHIVSHDLHQPLCQVSRCVELLKKHSRDALDAQSREYLDQIVVAADQMQALIQNLTAYSSTENGTKSSDQ